MQDHKTAAEYQEYLKTGHWPGEKKPHKYHAKRTEFNGKVYPSQKEANAAAEFKLRARAGEIIKVFEQVPFELPGGIVYKADFVPLYKDGHWEVVDAKGMRTDEYIIKKKLMKETYGIEIIEV